MSTHKPTQEQEAIITAAGTGDDLTIEAGAGTGKTSTLKMLSRAAGRSRGAYLAYNKSIAMDAARDFPSSVTCKTAHSFAYGAVGRQFAHRLNGPRVPARQAAILLGLTDPVKVCEVMLAPQQLARLVGDTIQRFCYSADDQVQRMHVPLINGLDRAGQAELARYLVPVAQRAWDTDLTQLNGSLRFTHDMYLKMWILSKPVIHADYVLLDEAQDSNGAVAGLVADQPAQRILVGDRCQPTGTLVTVVRGSHRSSKTAPARTVTEQVPIEQVSVGDRAVSYDMARSFLRRSGSVVSGITKRPFDGDLVTIKTGDGVASRYTPDHHCVVRISPALVGKHVVYLMRRGSSYRVGVAAGVYGSQGNRVGFVLRARAEDADATWVLSVHGTKREALCAEASIAGRFGLPQLTFKATNSSVFSQPELDDIWAQTGNNEASAAAALAAYGRDLRHPLWSREDERLLSRRSFVVRACNLLDGMHVLPVDGAMDANGKRVSRNRWSPITVGREVYTGSVYSMTVEGDHTYVGDGIVTHNCQAIYGWRGAVDAMQAFDGQRFQLSQSFRFGPAVAGEANKWLTLLDAPLRLTGYERIPSRLGHLPAADAILCRSNAGAIVRVIDAMGQGRRAALVGGGNDIRRMAEAAQKLMWGAPTDHPELFAFTTWREVQEYVEQGEGSDLKVFVKLIDRHGPDEVMRVCDALVDERHADVVVSTAHKAKGREWGSVRIASDFPEPKPREDGAVFVARDEAMLAYVAVTRAQLVLDRDGLSWVDRYVGRQHNPAAIMPDAPDPLTEIVDPPDGAETIPGDALSPDCYRCGKHYTACTCPLMPDRRPLAVAHG